MDRLKRNLPYLKALKNATPKRRKQILTASTTDHIKTLCDICLNVCQHHVDLSPKQIKCLQKHAKCIRALAAKKGSLKHKRKLLIQNGGFLPALLTPIIGAVGGLLGNLLGN